MAIACVSLQDVLCAIGGPLEEKSLWALLSQSTKSLTKALQGPEKPELLITPETTILFHGGQVRFLQGIAALDSTYTAPELILKNGHCEEEEKEKGYIYSLGTTLFNAMHSELENGKEPMVSSHLNGALLKMVGESADERASLQDIDKVCQQHPLEGTTAEEEVDKLVTYVMGTAPELSSSEYGDTDMDDANLESELKQVMKIQPTGSVEQLYSPSYGSRGSSSLSLNSSGNHSDLNINFHSSLPVVCSSSQERLGHKTGSGKCVSRPKWSSHDRLLSPLLSVDIENLALKGKKLQVESAAHKHYHSHLYTPKRTRKTGAAAIAVHVERSSSLKSTKFSRTSSDGISTMPLRPLVTMNKLNLDDMPALPPQTTRDAISSSPNDSLDTSTPMPVGAEEAAKMSCWPQHSEPTSHTHQDPDDNTPSNGSTTTDATFDYNDLSENGQSIGIHGDEDFDFTLPESSAPPPPTITSLPAEEQTPPTREITSPEKRTPPSPPTSPPHGEPSDEISPGGLNADTALEDSQIQGQLTPRTALRKAYEDLERIAVSKLVYDDDSMEGECQEDAAKKSGEVVVDMREDDEKEGVAVDVEHLYAKVDMTKKRKKFEDGKREDSAGDAGEDNERQSDIVDHLYAKVDLTKRTGQCPAHRKGEDENKLTTFQPELVHKAASVEKIVGPDYAEIQHPKRSSMPSSSRAQSPTHSEPGYETIKNIHVSPPHQEMTKPHLLIDQELHPSPGKLYEVTPNDTIDRKNQRSINKLSVMFGPEFKNLSGLQTLNKPKSVRSLSESSNAAVKVVPEGRRIVRVVMLNGRQIPFVVERQSLCGELFQQVLSHQSLQEKRFFGLAISKDWDEVFLEMGNKLSKYAPPGWVNTPVPTPGSKGQRPPHFIVFFRVQFYVENVNNLKFAQTRHLYYLQLRKDVLEGKTYCHEQPALKMASFALQAEKGDIPSKKQPYFRMEDYVPLKVLDKVGKKTTEELLPNMHTELRGVTREEAELEFLKEAQKLPEYGMVFYRVAQNKSDPIGSIWLGFCVRGIVVYDYHKNVKTPLYYCSWKKTQNLSFSNRKFIIELQDAKPMQVYTNSYKKARYLLHLSISYHKFQLMSRGHLPQESEQSNAEPLNSAEKETLFQGSGLGSALHGHNQKSHDQSQQLKVRLLKDSRKGLGINIIDLKESSGEGSGSCSQIVIESVVKGGPADINGKLKRGDIVVSVNGQSLAGLSRQEASTIIKNCVDVLDFVVLRGDQAVLPFHEPYIREPRSAVVEDPAREPWQPHMDRGSEEFVNLPEGETFMVHVKKEAGTFGLRIAGGKGKPFGGGFIYVKSLVEDTPAKKCNKLKERDIILKINGTPLVDITHRDVATLITTTQSDHVELLVHRPLSISWLESSHELYLSKQKVTGMRRSDVSWTELQPWMEIPPPKTLTTIKEREDNRDEELDEDDPLEHGEGSPSLLPNDDSLSQMKEELPSLPKEGPPSLIENDASKDSEDILPEFSLSEANKEERTMTAAAKRLRFQKEASVKEDDFLLTKEEPSFIHEQEHSLSPEGEPPISPEGEPPSLPQGEPPLDESSDESSWELEQSPDHRPTHAEHGHSERSHLPPHHMHASDTCSGDVLITAAVEQTGSMTATTRAGFTNGQPTISSHMTKRFSTPTTSGSTEDDSTSFDEAGKSTFTVTLKKGFRGLGFMLDKQRSLAEGGIFIAQIESDPAKSDGRLKPGDQIIEVDDDSLEGLSYRDALMLLRQTQGLVELVVMRAEEAPALPDTPIPTEDS